MILTSVSADFIGTNILYVVFYFFGGFLLARKPRWFPVSDKKIEKLTSRISKGGTWTLYVGRFAPLIRGYTSVIAGLLQIKPTIFLPVGIISAIVWSCTCVISGILLGPYWILVSQHFDQIKIPLLFIVASILLVVALNYFQKKEVVKNG